MKLEDQVKEMEIDEIVSQIENDLYYGYHKCLEGEDIVDLMQLIYKLAKIARRNK